MLRRIVWGPYGRYSAIAVVATFFIALSVIAYLRGWVDAWGYFQVSDPKLIFDDFRYIFRMADCLRNNTTPAGVDSCQMTQSVLWVYFINGLGISPAYLNIFGVTLPVIFLILALSFFKNPNTLEGTCIGLTLISPPSLLMMQRTNTDMIMFILVAIGCWAAVSKKEWISMYLSPLLILAAGFLKLFPIFALIGFLLQSPSKKRLWIFTLCMVVFAVYCLWTYDEILSGMKVTQYMHIYVSYGAGILPDVLFQDPYHNIIDAHRGLVRLILGAYTFMASCFFNMQFYPYFKQAGQFKIDNKLALYCFRAGASIFIFSYFIVGANWQYRLIFLILCLPQALSWIGAQNKMLKWQGVACTVLLILSLWLSNIFPDTHFKAFVLAKSIDWILCFALMCRLLIDMRFWGEQWNWKLARYTVNGHAPVAGG